MSIQSQISLTSFLLFPVHCYCLIVWLRWVIIYWYVSFQCGVWGADQKSGTPLFVITNLMSDDFKPYWRCFLFFNNKLINIANRHQSLISGPVSPISDIRYQITDINYQISLGYIDNSSVCTCTYMATLKSYDQCDVVGVLIEDNHSQWTYNVLGKWDTTDCVTMCTLQV